MKGKLKENKLFSVLLADDDADDCQLFLEAFNDLKLDIEVNTVRNGREALEFLSHAETPPDILFLDLNMPVMNGMECLKALKALRNYDNLCIAIYSTSSNEEDIEAALVMGAHVYIKKPSDFDQLKQILFKVISFNGHCQEPYLKRDFFMLNLGV